MADSQATIDSRFCSGAKRTLSIISRSHVVAARTLAIRRVSAKRAISPKYVLPEIAPKNRPHMHEHPAGAVCGIQVYAN
jgi:hypothetical protein